MLSCCHAAERWRHGDGSRVFKTNAGNPILALFVNTLAAFEDDPVAVLLGLSGHTLTSQTLFVVDQVRRSSS